MTLCDSVQHALPPKVNNQQLKLRFEPVSCYVAQLSQNNCCFTCPVVVGRERFFERTQLFLSMMNFSYRTAPFSAFADQVRQCQSMDELCSLLSGVKLSKELETTVRESIVAAVVVQIANNCESGDDKRKFLLANKRFEVIPRDLVAKMFGLLPVSDVINARNACKLFSRM